MTGPGGRAGVASYASGLLASADELTGQPYRSLCSALAAAYDAMTTAGPGLAAHASRLAQREGYLADANDRLLAAGRHLRLVLDDPDEEDLGVAIDGLLGAVGYLAEVAGDAVPEQVYVAVGRDLLAGLLERYGAPGLSLHLVPLVEAVLNSLRSVCLRAMDLVRCADALLATPLPTAEAPSSPSAAVAAHTAEIDRLIDAVREVRPVLAATPREDEHTYARALRDSLELTPRQLRVALERLDVGPG